VPFLQCFRVFRAIALWAQRRRSALIIAVLHRVVSIITGGGSKPLRPKRPACELLGLVLIAPFHQRWVRAVGCESWPTSLTGR